MLLNKVDGLVWFYILYTLILYIFNHSQTKQKLWVWKTWKLARVSNVFRVQSLIIIFYLFPVGLLSAPWKFFFSSFIYFYFYLFFDLIFREIFRFIFYFSGNSKFFLFYSLTFSRHFKIAVFRVSRISFKLPLVYKLLCFESMLE